MFVQACIDVYQDLSSVIACISPLLSMHSDMCAHICGCNDVMPLATTWHVYGIRHANEDAALLRP
jgi:hypothetical protein